MPFTNIASQRATFRPRGPDHAVAADEATINVEAMPNDLAARCRISFGTRLCRT
jgi:hypothetical protein